MKYIAVLFCALLSLLTQSSDSLSFTMEQELTQASKLHTFQLKQIQNYSDLSFTASNQLLVNKEYPDSVYAARLAAIPSVVDLTYNKLVKAHIEVYTKKKREMSERVLGLTQYYFPIFEAALDKYDLPYELKYMAVIESALNPRAISRVGASGLWQFMRYTGKQFGLEVNAYTDERFDVLKSTEAACKYMKNMYDIFGDWTLAIAAYNCGAGRVRSAVRRSGKKDFWNIYYYLPRETRGYVPIFIAAAYMINNYQYHGLTPKEVEFPLVMDTLHVNHNVHLAQIAAKYNRPYKQLLRLNPEFPRGYVLGGRKTRVVKVPPLSSGELRPDMKAIYAHNRSKFFHGNRVKNQHYLGVPNGYVPVEYVVQAGDNLGYIADWFDTWVSRVKSWNNLRRSTIRAGQKLRLYVPKSKKAYYQEITQKDFAWKQKNRSVNSHTALITKSENPNYKYYKVKKGDTMWNISNKHGVSVHRIKELNNHINHRKIKPGMLLLIKTS